MVKKIYPNEMQGKMVIRLGDAEDEVSERRSGLGEGGFGGVTSTMKIINSVRIRNIPLINFVVSTVLATFLVKLSFKYSNLYLRSSMVTLMVTNLVLYGISETVAQSILCYSANQPLVSFRLNGNANTRIFFDDPVDVETDPNGYSFDSDAENEDISSFINYMQQGEDNTSYGVQLPRQREENQTNPELPFAELTYFRLGKLVGFMCWGFLMAIFQSFWYRFLQIYSADPKFIEVLRKVLTDQLFYSPISLFCYFIYGAVVLENGNWEDAKAKLYKVYLATLFLNCSIWIPVQFINFLLVPRKYQVLFSSSISVLWNCFLSLRNSRS